MRSFYNFNKNYCFFFFLIYRIFTRPEKVIWHGIYPNGERAMGSFCDAWYTSSSYKKGLASPLYDNRLLSQEEFSCNKRLAVLCIEVVPPILRRRRHETSFSKYSNDTKRQDSVIIASQKKGRLSLSSAEEN